MSPDQVKLEHYLDAILLNLPVGVAILEGPDFRYFRINKRLADLNGLPVEDHLGRTVAEVLPNSPNILPNLRKVRNTGKPILGREFSTRLPNHPDKHVYLMDFHFPIRVEGEVRAVGAVVLDITERKQAEEALHTTQEELEVALAHVTRVSTLAELAASLSHELHQPLTAIVSNAQAGLRLLSRDTSDLDELHIALTQEQAKILRFQKRMKSLTPREREVFALVVTGMFNKHIAGELGTSEKTIKVHRSRVMQKMQADSLADLVRMADKLVITPRRG